MSRRQAQRIPGICVNARNAASYQVRIHDMKHGMGAVLHDAKGAVPGGV